MESQKDFENKVTEFIYRLAPMPGNVSELLDHCRVGMQLCKKWNFSQLLQQAVLRHHSPLNDGDFDYLGCGRYQKCSVEPSFDK
jgi:HD-like signal output (HDOD) protein